MLPLRFIADALPDSVASDFQNLNKFSEQQFVSLTDILFRFLVEPKEAERFLLQLSEFAAENGMSAGPLRNLVKNLLLVPQGALKRSLSAEQLKEDLVSLGLNEDKAIHFSSQWKVHYAVLSRLAVGQTLMVNQLVDMEWKFGGKHVGSGNEPENHTGRVRTRRSGNVALQSSPVIAPSFDADNHSQNPGLFPCFLQMGSAGHSVTAELLFPSNINEQSRRRRLSIYKDPLVAVT
uniref:COMM domain containing 7 n=1 Tax=Paramormyrops kingsleyae TaxID=1676925 RepID=A0A3B3RLX2_9TELE